MNDRIRFRIVKVTGDAGPVFTVGRVLILHRRDAEEQLNEDEEGKFLAVAGDSEIIKIYLQEVRE